MSVVYVGQEAFLCMLNSANHQPDKNAGNISAFVPDFFKNG